MTDHIDPAGDNARAARERELLSALMDGEAGEHELRQALKVVGDDPSLLATWSRWHVAQSVLRGENVRPASIDLRAAVAAAIDGEPAVAGSRPGARPWLRPLAGFAVAASVAMVTVFGWQMMRGGVDAATVADNGEAQQTVALGPMVVVREDGEELALPTAAVDTQSPTAGQDRLNAYLARHAQASRGLAPYARVVSFEGEQGR